MSLPDLFPFGET